jgi:hypothetical protein
VTPAELRAQLAARYPRYKDEDHGRLGARDDTSGPECEHESAVCRAGCGGQSDCGGDHSGICRECSLCESGGHSCGECGFDPRCRHQWQCNNCSENDVTPASVNED